MREHTKILTRAAPSASQWSECLRSCFSEAAARGISSTQYCAWLHDLSKSDRDWFALLLRVPLRPGMSSMHSEIQVLSKFRHPNIIRLEGYCIPNSAIAVVSSDGSDDAGGSKKKRKVEQQLCLIYEFAAQGSLDTHLKDDTKAAALSWSKRIHILAEVN